MSTSHSNPPVAAAASSSSAKMLALIPVPAVPTDGYALARLLKETPIINREELFKLHADAIKDGYQLAVVLEKLPANRRLQVALDFFSVPKKMFVLSARDLIKLLDVFSQEECVIFYEKIKKNDAVFLCIFLSHLPFENLIDLALMHLLLNPQFQSSIDDLILNEIKRHFEDVITMDEKEGDKHAAVASQLEKVSKYSRAVLTLINDTQPIPVAKIIASYSALYAKPISHDWKTDQTSAEIPVPSLCDRCVML